MQMPVRVGDHVARVLGVMRGTHDGVCRRRDGHRWETCPVTPSLVAVGDAVDLLDLGASADQVASALHARLCRDGECGIADARDHARWAFGPTARVLHERFGRVGSEPPA